VPFGVLLGVPKGAVENAVPIVGEGEGGGETEEGVCFPGRCCCFRKNKWRD
jgi:hypothetical protein